MSRKGNCWDNSCAEAFFKTIKTVVLNERYLKDYEEAKICILEYIEVFYNRERRHSSIGYMSSVEFEKKEVMCLALSAKNWEWHTFYLTLNYYRVKFFDCMKNSIITQQLCMFHEFNVYVES